MLREVAEYPNSFGPLGPLDERIETARFTLCMGPGVAWNTLQRQHFQAAAVDEVLDEVRSLLRERGRIRRPSGRSAARPSRLASWSSCSGAGSCTIAIRTRSRSS